MIIVDIRTFAAIGKHACRGRTAAAADRQAGLRSGFRKTMRRSLHVVPEDWNPADH